MYQYCAVCRCTLHIKYIHIYSGILLDTQNYIRSICIGIGMYICMYLYVDVNMYACVYTYVHMYIHITCGYISVL